MSISDQDMGNKSVVDSITEDTAVVMDLDVLVSQLSLISRDKKLRSNSVASVKSSSVDSLVKQLNLILENAHKWHVNDIGLILHWIDVALREANSSDATQLMIIQAKLLEKALTAISDSHKKESSRNRFQKTMLYRAKRSVREMALANRDTLDVVEFCAECSKHGIYGLVAISQLVLAYYAPLPKFPETVYDEVVDLYLSAVLNAKPQAVTNSVKPLASSGLLDPIAANLITQANFDSKLVPALQKALLRSPLYIVEVIIPSLLSNKSLNTNKLAEQPSLASGLNSQDANLRKATASAFKMVLENSSECAPKNLVEQFKKTTNSEQRIMYANVFIASKPSAESIVPEALALQAGREGSDIALAALARAMVSQITDSSDTYKGCLETFKKGLAESRPQLRREWICAACLTTESRAIFRKELEEAWEDSKQGALSRGLFPSAYAIIAGDKPLDVPPALFSKNVIEHAVSDRDIELLFNAASKCLDIPEAINALVYCCTHGSAFSRVENRRRLTDIFDNSNNEITLKQLTLLKEALMASVSTDTGRLVSSVRHRDWPKVSFVLCHTEGRVPPKGWIALCLDCHVDPNALASTDGQELFESSVEARNPSAIATLGFIAPEFAIPKIVDLFKGELIPEKMSQLDEKLLSSDIGTFIDDSPSGRTRNKPKEKSDDAWEAELRAEIAAKRGELTKEQQEKLEYQDKRRAELSALQDRAEFACQVLKALAADTVKGATNSPAEWIPSGLISCLEVFNTNAPGKAAAEKCVVSLSSCLSDRFQGRWKSIAADLLLQGSSVDAENLRRMMYMLNPVSDKRLLNEQSLAYILPILVAFISRVANEMAGSVSIPGADRSNQDLGEENIEEETVLLILSLLSNQAAVLARVPRGNLIGALHELLASFAVDRPAVKDCLSRIVQCTILDDAELHALLTASIAVPQEFVQTAALEILDEEVDLSEFCPEIWIARYGPHSALAQDIFTDSDMSIPSNILELLIPFFADQYQASHAALARSYAAAVIATSANEVGLNLLCQQFTKLQPPPVTGNRLPLGLAPRRIDHSNERLALLSAIGELIPHLVSEDVISCAKFIVTVGVVDSNSNVSAFALEIGKQLISAHGGEYADGLLPLFEEGNVVLFGFAAQYLPANDPRLEVSIDRLLRAVNENAEGDEAVAAVASASVSALVAVAPLAPSAVISDLLRKLSQAALSPTSVSSRRGAALGFAGIASGLGLRVLGEVDITAQISSASGDRKNAGSRAGAQFMISALAEVFGPVFEPYALELMPEILAGLGDAQAIVRAPAGDAARKVMGLATAYGVGVLIPMALSQLDQSAWRSKKGAVELLGSMAFLSPRQLSASLATIVPEIVALLSDTHKEVRAAASAAMRTFGDVIQNPEIQQLVPSLLRAVSNPTEHTDSALTELLKTRFIHYIDSPSLALVIFVVQRGLRDRSAGTKRKACQIVGNMSILTSSEDLAPYLPAIMPDLEVAMTDPVPQTCAVACKALGVLVEKLGEEVFPDVVSNMFEKLKSSEPEAIGERWGTAQGLAEVLHGLGIRRLEKELPEIVACWNSPEVHIRQGFAPLLLLLPGSFGSALTPYLGTLVPALLNGLADSSEDIRDNALKAGRRIVKGYASVAMDLLLPELEVGLWSSSWRIRLASVELVGDLLNQLLGRGIESSVTDRMKSISTAKPDDEGNLVEDADEAADAETPADLEDENLSTPNLEASLQGLEILGRTRRDRVLSGIFVCRADVVGAVRQAALDIWLGLIQNTPRVVKTILPTLVLMIVKHLGDDDEEIQRNAGRALAELVRRVSSTLDNVLPTLIHLLPERDARKGICEGLVELIPATQVSSLKTHESELMRIVRTCLQDSDENVRTAATRALEQLHSVLGDVSGDMLPEMVSEVVENNDESSLAAIKEMLASTGSNTILQTAIPPLLKKISSSNEEFHAIAVAEICEVAGRDESRLFAEDIVETLIRTKFTDILGRILMVYCPENHMLTLAKRDDALRSDVFKVMASYYSNAISVDMLFVSDWVVFALHGLENQNTSESAQGLLAAFTTSTAITKQQLATLSSTAYQTISVLSKPIAAFSAPPKGPAFILPIFLNSLILGSNLEKEQSALAISEIVHRTDPVESLKPVVTQITGPLIRIVGERASADVKAAIIYTLNELLTAIPMFLKPFLPQLQRTFAKNLGDTTSQTVRTRSAMALTSLVKHQTRVDPLAREVLTGLRSSEDAGVRASYLSALHGIVRFAGSHLGEEEKLSIAELVAKSEDLTSGKEDQKLQSLLARIGSDLVALADDPASAKKLVDSMLSGSGLQPVLSANALFVYAPKVATAMAGDLKVLFESATSSSSPVICEYGVRGLGKLLLTLNREDNTAVYDKAISSLISVVPKQDNRSAEARRLTLVVLSCLVSRDGYEVLQPYWDILVPDLFLAARDTIIPVKIAAEVTFSAVFDFIARQDSILFDEYFATAKDSLDARLQRSMPEYVRRVAMKAAQRSSDSEETNIANAQADLAEVWDLGSE